MKIFSWATEEIKEDNKLLTQTQARLIWTMVTCVKCVNRTWVTGWEDEEP
jgi:hypothetical protein